MLNKSSKSTFELGIIDKRYSLRHCKNSGTVFIVTMIQKKEINFQGIKHRFQVKPWDDVTIVLNVLIAHSLFIIFHQNLINPNWF
jgi:hypothetical protein